MKRAPISLTNAELPAGDRPIAIPDRESTAPHWHGSAAGLVNQLRSEVSRLNAALAKSEAEKRELLGRITDVTGPMIRLIHASEEASR